MRSMRRSTSMSRYCTGTLVLQRNAPTGMRCTMTITLLMYGEMRSGVCGQRGSGGKALSVAAEAMPHRSAPSSSARRFDLRRSRRTSEAGYHGGAFATYATVW